MLLFSLFTAMLMLILPSSVFVDDIIIDVESQGAKGCLPLNIAYQNCCQDTPPNRAKLLLGRGFPHSLDDETATLVVNLLRDNDSPKVPA